MRKKIMATVLGTVMLLTAVSFTGCGRSVKDSTSTKTEKTTKETKRDEKIEIKILSKYDQIKKLLEIKNFLLKERSDKKFCLKNMIKQKILYRKYDQTKKFVLKT